MTASTGISTLARCGLFCITLLLALPSLARAGVDYGAVFFSIPLGSSIDEAEKIMQDRLKSQKDLKIRRSTGKDGIIEIRGEFQGGFAEVRFRDDKIEYIRFRVDRVTLKTVRSVDTFMLNKLGPIGFIELEPRQIFFDEPKFDECLNQCKPQCGEFAPSAYHCAKGKVCQAACLTKTLPSSPADLQNFLLDRVTRNEDFGTYVSYWPCDRRAKSTNIVLAPFDGCSMSFTVKYCKGYPDKTFACSYEMDYFSK
ncbi:MAG: hypothetical protein KDJ17_09775 [Hyphomicrobiaceae bacterium]|nr:hypothetical protein [Hyphomicrobiaceae bacterium]